MEEKMKKVKVKIPRIDKKQQAQYISVNNYTCMIKPGVEVEVPDFVAEVLQHKEEMLEIAAAYEEANQNKNLN